MLDIIILPLIEGFYTLEMLDNYTVQHNAK